MPSLPLGNASGNKGSTSQLAGGSVAGNGSAAPANGDSPGSGSSPSGLVHPHPYRHPLLANAYDDDFPLRKTGTRLRPL